MAHSTASSSSCWGGQFFTTAGSPPKQTAEPSLCSIAGVCLGIVSAGVRVHEMLLAAPRGTCRRLRRGGMGLIDVDRPEI